MTFKLVMKDLLLLLFFLFVFLSVCCGIDRNPVQSRRQIG